MKINNENANAGSNEQTAETDLFALDFPSNSALRRLNIQTAKGIKIHIKKNTTWYHLHVEPKKKKKKGREQDGGGVGVGGHEVHLSPQIHQEYTFRRRVYAEHHQREYRNM